MKYCINSSEIQDFYNRTYLENGTSGKFSFKNDEINMGMLNMSVTEWGIPKFRAHLINSEADRKMQIVGGIQEDVVILHFVCKGKTQVNRRGASYSVDMIANTNNLFCGMGDKNKHLLNEHQQNEYFRIYIPYDYIHSMTPQYPDVFGTLSQLIDNQCPILRDGHLTTTMEMNQLIEQIKNCQDMGSLAPLYFETKVHELLILQIQQINKQDHIDCNCYIHYQEQINEARNIIENNFLNPPTICELAKMVSMSETVLKASFKLFFGATIYGYLFNFRMNIARKLLSDNSITVAEIASKSGYEYSSHFTTAFKRRFGLSPVEYRKNSA